MYLMFPFCLIFIESAAFVQMSHCSYFPGLDSPCFNSCRSKKCWAFTL